MLLQLFGMAEGIRKLGDHMALLFGQRIGICRVHRWKITVLQGIDLPIDGNGLVLIVDLVQQQPVRHVKLRVTQQLLSLQLEQDHCNGLIHPGREQLILLCTRVIVHQLYLEAMGIRILIDLVGKNTQRPQGNAIARLDHIQIVVMDGIGQHRGHHSPGATGRAHPENIVVAPLDIHAVAGHQTVHDNIRPGPSVKNIAYNMQVVHRHGFNHPTDGLDHLAGLTDLQNGIDQGFIVGLLEFYIRPAAEQLVNDIGIIRWHGIPQLIAGMLCRYEPAQIHQPLQRDPVPLLHILHCICRQRQLCRGVVDQCSQIIQLLIGEIFPEQGLQLIPHLSGAGI